MCRHFISHSRTRTEGAGRKVVRKTEPLGEHLQPNQPITPILSELRRTFLPPETSLLCETWTSLTSLIVGCTQPERGEVHQRRQTLVYSVHVRARSSSTKPPTKTHCIPAVQVRAASRWDQTPPNRDSLQRADSPLERRTMFSRKVFCGATSPLFPPGILLRTGGAGVARGLWRWVCCSELGFDAGSQSARWRSSL